MRGKHALPSHSSVEVSGMKAAIYKGIGQIDIEEVETPKISDNEALVRVGMVGVCGTDLKTFSKGHHMFRPPCVLGHEFTGRIVEKGRNIDIDVDDAVHVFAPYIECGNCALCLRGVPELCKRKHWIEGALAEYVKVPGEIIQRAALRSHEDIPESVLTLTEPLACAIHCIEKARIASGNKVLVVGSGPMGLLIGSALKNMGSDCLISDIDKSRLRMAEKCGLEAIDFSEKNFSEFLMREPSYDSVVLANDKKELVSSLIPLVLPGGTFQLFGGMSKDTRFEIDPYHIHYREVDLVGSFGFSEKDFKKAFGFISGDPDSFSTLITAVFNLNDIHNAFKAAKDKSNIKVVVRIT